MRGRAWSREKLNHHLVALAVDDGGTDGAAGNGGGCGGNDSVVVTRVVMIYCFSQRTNRLISDT